MRASSQAAQSSPSHQFTKEDLGKAKVKYQNAYVKRYERNLYQFNLKPVPAEMEALIFIGRLIYLDDQKQQNKKAQMPLFDTAQAGRKARVV